MAAGMTRMRSIIFFWALILVPTLISGGFCPNDHCQNATENK